MKTTTINISMPQTLADFVKRRMAASGYGNTSEYFRHLVREDQKREEEERIEELLLDGLESGKPIDVTDEWWEKRREKLASRVKKRKTA